MKLRRFVSKEELEKLIEEKKITPKRRYTYFFDVTDISITPLIWWRNSRIKKYQELANKIIYLNIDK